MSEAAHPVFLSYARRSSLEAARTLAGRLGDDTAFLDTEDVALGETFPAVLRDAVLEARVMVVFATETYFTRPYGWKEWHLALAPWRTLLQRRADSAALEAALAHLVLVLPEPGARIPSDRLPPSPRRRNWPHAGELDVVASFVEERLRQVTRSIGATLDDLGVREAVATGVGGADLLLPVRAPVGRLVLEQTATSLDEGFVGRAVELHQLDDLLRPGDGGRGGLVAVTGAVLAGGGFGKSRLALEYVWRYQPLRFPGGVFWVDADVAPEALESQRHRVLRTFVPGLPGLPQLQAEGRDVAAELDDALRQHQDDGPFLVVLDNVPEPGPGEAPASLDALFPGRRWVTLLATSRRRIDEARAATLAVDVLDPDAARRLLLQNVDRRGGVPEAAWDAVTAWVGRLPLALVLLNRGLFHGVSCPANSSPPRGGRARSRPVTRPGRRCGATWPTGPCAASARPSASPSSGCLSRCDGWRGPARGSPPPRCRAPSSKGCARTPAPPPARPWRPARSGPAALTTRGRRGRCIAWSRTFFGSRAPTRSPTGGRRSRH
ncbi:MAG: TIR domain-containing protein [Myxococcota bacterium]